MARFTANTAIDMQAFLTDAALIEFFANAEVVGTPTRVTFTDSFDGITETLVVRGTFGNFFNGVPTTGELTRADYAITGGASFSLTGFTMTVAEFNAYIESEDALGMFAQILGGNDTIRGSTGSDVLLGFGGNDNINGRSGADIMAGMDGNDRYTVDNGSDVVVELVDEGYDTVTSVIDYTLGANVEALRLAGGATTGTGNDLANDIFGTDSINTLTGLDGNDTIIGYGGRDTISGGAGADTIEGGAGRDRVTGNGGADDFVFRDGDTFNTRGTADIITDFSQAQGDTIELNLIDANVNLEGNQRFAFINDRAFTGTAGQLRYAQADGNTYIEGDTNGDGVADLVIALNGTITLVTGDFVL